MQWLKKSCYFFFPEIRPLATLTKTTTLFSRTSPDWDSKERPRLKAFDPGFLPTLIFLVKLMIECNGTRPTEGPHPLSSLSSVTKLGIRNRTIVVFKRKPCLRFCCVFFQSRWRRWTKRICQNFYFCGLEGVFVSVLDDFDTNSGDDFDRVFRCWFKFKCWLKR